MDTLDIFLKKYSYKFPKGYPNMNNEHDILLMEGILSELGVDLQEQQLDIEFPLDDEIKQLISTLDDYEVKKRILKMLKKANKKEDIYDEDEVKDSKNSILQILKDEKKLADNYANAIYRISLDLGEYKKLNAYLKNPTITILPESGNLEELFTPTFLSKDFITELIELYGRSTGKGEMALITFLKGCTARGGKKEENTGDVKIGEKSIEIKQGNAFKLVPFEISKYGSKPSAYLKEKTNLEFPSGELWPRTLQSYWKEEEVSTELINDIIKDFYGNYVPKIEDQQLQISDGLLNHIADNLAKEYIEKSKPIMVISSNFPYTFKQINKYDDNYKNENNLKISTFSDKFPRFAYTP